MNVADRWGGGVLSCSPLLVKDMMKKGQGRGPPLLFKLFVKLLGLVRAVEDNRPSPEYSRNGDEIYCPQFPKPINNVCFLPQLRHQHHLRLRYDSHNYALLQAQIDVLDTHVPR